MRTVSARLQRRIARDFPSPGSAEEVIRALAGVSDSERVQAAIPLRPTGTSESPREVELAVVDWRDVLVNGDLAHDGWQGVPDSDLGPARTYGRRSAVREMALAIDATLGGDDPRVRSAAAAIASMPDWLAQRRLDLAAPESR